MALVARDSHTLINETKISNREKITTAKKSQNNKKKTSYVDTIKLRNITESRKELRNTTFSNTVYILELNFIGKIQHG